MVAINGLLRCFSLGAVGVRSPIERAGPLAGRCSRAIRVSMGSRGRVWPAMVVSAVGV